MVLRLDQDWVWDMWFADDGNWHHMFFLKAPRSLAEERLRHRNARVGHARSKDLVAWELLSDPLAEPVAGLDDQATWTGSVVRGTDGRWWMFHSGISKKESGRAQRIGAAVSDDLVSFRRTELVMNPDPRWYEVYEGLEGDRGWHEQAWRDPWVFLGPDSTWHMLVTGRSRTGPPDGRGVVAHATSPDLEHWTIGPPLSAPAGFGHLEVFQVAEVDGRWVLLFSCDTSALAEDRRAAGEVGGIWAVNAPGPTGPFDIASAYLVAEQSLYVGRLVQDRAGRWVILAFEGDGAEHPFVGQIIDPRPVSWSSDRLHVGP